MASKATMMQDGESILNEDTAEDIKDEIAGAAQAIENFEEARSEAADGFAEAFGYHEEREWESRDGTLEGINDNIERMSNALDELDGFGVVVIDEHRYDGWRVMIEKAQAALDGLL
jgi:ferritin-like metal-binding protein YciE